jgi:hypothetical protein
MVGISIVVMRRMLCAVVVGNGLVSTATLVNISVSVMPGLKEMFDAAIGSGQQPKHHTAGRHEAESGVKFWRSRDHTICSLCNRNHQFSGPTPLSINCQLMRHF